MRQDIKLIRDGIRIGECNINDSSLISCTGGCNDLGTGNGHCAMCDVGQSAAVNIKCHESKLISQLFFILYQETKKIEENKYLSQLKKLLSSDQVSALSQLSQRHIDQLSQLTSEQIDMLIQIPPGFDFSKISGNNVTFDNAVKVFENVDPKNLPILKEYVDYYEDY